MQKHSSYYVIGAAMEVHRHLGTGFQEVIYQRSLEIEMRDQGIRYIREFEMPVKYKQHEVGIRRVDFLVDDGLLVEIKAIKALEDVHLAQAKNYLEAYDLRDGLLINFGAQSLEYKRLYNH
ncbi:MAG: GxxExxY protein [Bacteroidota bacterium]